MLITLLAIGGVVFMIATIAAMTHEPAPPTPLAEPDRLKLQHSLNRTLCVGCEMCVMRCPVDVLALDAEHKATVVNKAACISCRLCEEVCPTPVKALRMHAPDRPVPTIEMPDLDEFYQARGTPGLYVVGEVAGKPMIKNGINLGQAAVEHLIREHRHGGEQSKSADAVLDVIIIGAGPAGLSAGIACREGQLRYVILERELFAMATVMTYPKGKSVHAVPHQLDNLGRLWLPEKQCAKEDLCERWNAEIDKTGLEIQTGVDVVNVHHENGLFRVELMRGEIRLARNIIAAIGGRGPLPMLALPSDRSQDVPGQNLQHVYRAPPEDPADFRNQKIIVIGGGNTAIEVAVELARPEFQNKVFLSYHRAETFLKANRDNLCSFRSAVKEQRILPLYEANPLSFVAGSTKMQLPNRVTDIETDAVFILIGYNKVAKWLNDIGVGFRDWQHDKFELPDSATLLRSLLAQRVERSPVPAVTKPQARTLEAGPFSNRLPASWNDTVLDGKRSSLDSTDSSSQLPADAPGDQMPTVIEDNMTARMGAQNAGACRPPTPPSVTVGSVFGRANQTIRIPGNTRLLRMPSKATIEEALQSSTLKRTAPR